MTINNERFTKSLSLILGIYKRFDVLFTINSPVNQYIPNNTCAYSDVIHGTRDIHYVILCHSKNN